MTGTDASSDAAAVTRRVQQLEDDVTKLAGHVSRLLAERRPSGEQAWWWPDLDTNAAGNAWETLAAWVDQCLLPRFPRYARDLRPCWRLHPDVVDELTALRVLWVDAYTNPRARPTAAAEYRGRWVPQAMTRIEDAFTRAGCTPGTNSSHGTNTPAPLPGWVDRKVADFLSTDLTGRPT